MEAPYKKKNRITKTQVEKLPADHPDRILLQGKEEREKREKEKSQKGDTQQ